MASLSQIPENVRSAVAAHEDEVLWSWVEAQIAEQVLSEAGEDALLVRIGRGFDFAALVLGCAGYHVYAGQRGQAPQHRIACLCQALVVKWLYGWSYERTVREVRSHRLVRWFVGLALHEPCFSAVTLWRFEQWVKAHQPRLFFNEVLKQIEVDFPQEGRAAQVGDTFALESRAAEQTRTQLVRGTAQRLLKALALMSEALAGQVDAAFGAAGTLALFGPADEPREHWLDKAQRDGREVATALAARRLLDVVQAAVAPLPQTRQLEWLALQRWLGLLDKVLADEFVFTADESGQWLSVRHCTDQERGRFVLGSAVDPEATFRKHGEKTTLGYNISLAATPNFVFEIAAATGATPDSVGVAPLIAEQLEQRGAAPPKLLYDRAAGMPKVFAEVDKASDGQTQLVARLIDYGKRSERFGPQDFTLIEHNQLRCPNGQTTSKAYRAGGADGWNYRFAAAQCTGCPLWDKCRSDKVKPNSHRQVFISDYALDQQQALAYTKTAAFAQEMKQRSNIERIIAGLVRYNGARRATGYGLLNADYQARCAAMAYNLKRWAKLQQEEEKAARRRAKPPPPS